MPQVPRMRLSRARVVRGLVPILLLAGLLRASRAQSVSGTPSGTPPTTSSSDPRSTQDAPKMQPKVPSPANPGGEVPVVGQGRVPMQETQPGPTQQPIPESQTSAVPPAPSTPQVSPLGTGAAPDLGSRGVPASRPAGAAIAPAKQRRVSIISVRTALLVGGAVALGVVTGLTLGTSARP